MIAPARHQIVIERKPSTGFKRFENIGTSAIAATRLPARKPSVATPPSRSGANLRNSARTAMSAQRSRGMRARACISLAQFLTERVNAENSATIGPVLEAVLECLTASGRLADLLAAERHIGRCRGIA